MSMWTNSEAIRWEGQRVLPQGPPPTLDGVRLKPPDAHLIVLAALVVSVCDVSRSGLHWQLLVRYNEIREMRTCHAKRLIQRSIKT